MNEGQNLDRDGTKTTTGIGEVSETASAGQGQDEIVEDGNGLDSSANG
jgi:hypothetical protein